MKFWASGRGVSEGLVGEMGGGGRAFGGGPDGLFEGVWDHGDGGGGKTGDPERVWKLSDSWS